MQTSIVYLCKNCRITPGHHKYFESPAAAESYFIGKAYKTFTDVMKITSSPNKNSRNLSEVHLDIPMSEAETCDYICYKNENSNVLFINRIYHVENTHRDTTRIQFEIDHYATYIGYIDLGWAHVERTHVNETSIYDSLLDEPMQVPRVITRIPVDAISSAWETLHSDMVYAIYLSSNLEGDSNSPEVKIRQVGGTPVYGYQKIVKTTAEVETSIKTYFDRAGWALDSKAAAITNTQQVIYAPSALFGESPLIQQVIQKFTPEKRRFLKCNSPQYWQGKLVSLSSGLNIPINILSGETRDGEFTVSFTIRGVGGVNPMTAMAINMPDGTSSNTVTIAQIPYPALPVSMFMGQQQTTYGQVMTIINSVFDKASKGAAMGASVGGWMNSINPTYSRVGLGVGTAAGIAEGVGSVMNYEQRTAHTYNLNTTSSAEYANAHKLYDYEFLLDAPTQEGYLILESFFDTYGYNVSRRMKIDLNVKPNYTYIKISGGMTATSDTAPQNSIDAIANMLNNGLTVWNADIGSQEHCE